MAVVPWRNASPFISGGWARPIPAQQSVHLQKKDIDIAEGLRLGFCNLELSMLELLRPLAVVVALGTRATDTRGMIPSRMVLA